MVYLYMSDQAYTMCIYANEEKQRAVDLQPPHERLGPPFEFKEGHTHQVDDGSTRLGSVRMRDTLASLKDKTRRSLATGKPWYIMCTSNAGLVAAHLPPCSSLMWHVPVLKK
jgi:hypothetical protein